MTPDPYTLARGNAARRAYRGATTMTQQRRFKAAEMEAQRDHVLHVVTHGQGASTEQWWRDLYEMLRQGADDATVVEIVGQLDPDDDWPLTLQEAGQHVLAEWMRDLLAAARKEGE